MYIHVTPSSFGNKNKSFDFLLDALVSIFDRKGKVSRGELLSEITKLKEEIVGELAFLL